MKLLSKRLSITAIALLASLPVMAQEMGQGEANITARAEVRMSIESGAATNNAKLQRIAEVVTTSLAAVRECYRARVEERPVTQGELRLMVDLEGRGSVEVTRDSLEDEPLLRCVLRAMRRAPLRDVRPPGSAFVILTFENSAAEGVRRTQERRAVEDAVEVTRNPEGRLTARGGNDGGEVGFVVTGGPDATEEQVAATQRGLRAAIPVLLDCRRKAARTESPEGEIELDARFAARGRPRLRVVRSTVSDARGSRCLTRFLPREPFDAATRGAARITIRFNDTARSSGALHPQHDAPATMR